MAPAFLSTLSRKLLHVEPDGRYAQVPKDLETRAREVICPAEPYVEGEPTVAEWLKECVPTKQGALEYGRDLFPFAQWLPKYNLRWVFGDAIAGKSLSISGANAGD